MTRPLHSGAAKCPVKRPPDGHGGLWFDKFFDQWRYVGGSWTMASDRGDGNGPKLRWIATLTSARVGVEAQIREHASRLARLVEGRGGRLAVLTTESRFVTGLGRSHPVGNGFAWHPTLGIPCLPGSSIKGAVRAWARLDTSPPVPGETVERLFGGPGSTGGSPSSMPSPSRPFSSNPT